MKFSDIQDKQEICLYCGDMDQSRIVLSGIPFTGLSLFQNNSSHIQTDITKKLDLYDASVDLIQSEDVFEHIEYDLIPNVLQEMYRVIKPGGYLRLSVPDYRCDVLYERSNKDVNGTIIFDAGGGGVYDEVNKKVTQGGHVWFPTYELVKQLVDKSSFKHYVFYHYYDKNNKPVTKDISYEKGYISRTPDHDKRVQNPRRPMSIVVDLFKR